MPASSVCSIGRDRSFSSNRSVEAVSFIRHMRGGCQSSLITASDGCSYVLKMKGNPQGANVLANEAFGSMLASHLGIPVAGHAYVHTSQKYIAGNPDLMFMLERDTKRPAAGLHYGSRVVAPEDLCYEILPGNWFQRIANRPDFMSMLIVDLWTEHCDNRQAIFTKDPDGPGLHATFIDHGHMFGGPNWDSQLRTGTCLYLDHRIYEGLWHSPQIAATIDKIGKVDAATMFSFLEDIPKGWSRSSFRGRIESLLRRSGLVGGLFLQEKAAFEKRQEMRLRDQGRNDIDQRDPVCRTRLRSQRCGKQRIPLGGD